METLPVELRRDIVQHLAPEDLKSIRLASKLWATLGEEYLISPTFSALPYRGDLDRLESISRNLKFCFRITSLNLNHGEVNEYHARHNTYFLQYMQEPDDRLEAQSSTWASYAELRELKDQYLPEFFDFDRLVKIFSGLSNLESLEVTLMTCPFQEETHPYLLKDIWGIPSTRLLPRVATTERFTILLTALASNISIISLKSVSHDRLPFEFFAQRLILIEQFSLVFRSLTSLKLTIDYSDMPNNLHYAKGFHNLFQCLSSPTSLRNLELAFLGRKKLDVSPLFSSFQEHGYAFPALQDLKLKGIATTEEELCYFLKRQKTLKRLQLGGSGLRARHQTANGGVHLSKGSFRAVFESVNKELSLESFMVQGDLIGLESGERWILDKVDAQENLKEYVTD
ncbi:hypothetical protein G7Y89_g14785 [Cudoniella acicularis]|uniref:F-box domain-containing protein n=1 Tax=Cudoniella acicularis TaxID=354080 RepID=A0A8H4QYL5_9HELO|nr:hypothetical protein G7Y89_g14785 [Cudoniella acicularis]